jgi:hypothetical protein
MRLDAALVCIAALWGIDRFMFDGRYLAIISSLLSEIYTHW